MTTSADRCKDKEDSASARRERDERNNYGGGPFGRLRAVRLRSEAPFAVGRPNRFGFTCHCTAITVHFDIAVVVVRREQGKQAKTKLALE